MAWGQAIGAGIGAIATHIEGALNRHHNSKEARAADARALNMWRSQQLEQYKLSRQGLEDAGYNPMLAINGGLASHSIPSSHSGSSTGIPDIAGSAKQGAELVNDVLRAFDDKHQESNAQTDLLVSEAEAKKTQSENDTLRTLSQLENDAVERDLKESQNTKTKVDTISQPLSDAAKIGTGAATAWALNKLRQKVVEKFAPRVIPLLKHAPKGVRLFNPLTALPTLFGGVATAIGYEGFKRTNHQQNEKLKRSGGTYQHGNWSR